MMESKGLNIFKTVYDSILISKELISIYTFPVTH